MEDPSGKQFLIRIEKTFYYLCCLQKHDVCSPPDEGIYIFGVDGEVYMDSMQGLGFDNSEDILDHLTMNVFEWVVGPHEARVDLYTC